MSDAQLQDLERAWRASGRVADEVALIRGRLRAGALTPQRLRLAAFCGGEAAREVCGDGWRERGVLAELYQDSLECSARASYVVARHHVFPRFPTIGARPDSQAWLAALRAVVESAGAAELAALEHALVALQSPATYRDLDEINLWQFMFQASSLADPNALTGNPNWGYMPDLLHADWDYAPSRPSLQRALTHLVPWLLALAPERTL